MTHLDPPPHLTGSRFERFMAVVKDAPRDPSCGCIMFGETARRIVEAIFSEQKKIDIEMEMTNGETKDEGQP